MPWPRLSRSASPGNGRNYLPMSHLPTIEAANSEPPSRPRSRNRSRSRSRHSRSSSAVAQVNNISVSSG